MKIMSGTMTAAGERTVIVACAGLVLLVSFGLLDPVHALVSSALGLTMLAIAVADARYFLIPDVLCLPAIPAGLIVTWFLANNAVLEHAIAALIWFAILWLLATAFYRVRKIQGLGFGDIKLGAAAGAWNGFDGATHALLLACLLAICVVIGLTLASKRQISRSTVLPFGVFFAPCIWLVWCLVNSGHDLGSYIAALTPSFD